MRDLDEWPCQQLMGGTGAAIYSNVDGMCTHPECHPDNDDRIKEPPNQVDAIDKKPCNYCNIYRGLGFEACPKCDRALSE